MARRVGKDDEHASGLRDATTEGPRPEGGSLKAARIEVRHREIEVNLLRHSLRPLRTHVVWHPLKGQLHG